MLTALYNSPPSVNPIPALSPAAWFRAGYGITVTGSGVSLWADQSGNGRDLLQGTDASRPALQVDGSVLFDGTDDYLKTAAFTLNQPRTFYIVGKTNVWQLNGAICDGQDGNVSVLYNQTATPTLGLYAGSVANANANLAVGAYGIITAVFNGTSSLLQINAGTAATGDPGAGNITAGLILGAYFNGSSQWWAGQAKELIAFSAAHTAAQMASVQQWLNYVHHVY